MGTAVFRRCGDVAAAEIGADQVVLEEGRVCEAVEVFPVIDCSGAFSFGFEGCYPESEGFN